MIRRKLPIGIQIFREIREGGHSYVDKTAFAGWLLYECRYYILSRPRALARVCFWIR